MTTWTNSRRFLAFAYLLTLFWQELTALTHGKQWVVTKRNACKTLVPPCCAPLVVYLWTLNLKANIIYWENPWGSPRGTGSKNSAGDREGGFASGSSGRCRYRVKRDSWVKIIYGPPSPAPVLVGGQCGRNILYYPLVFISKKKRERERENLNLRSTATGREALAFPFIF